MSLPVSTMIVVLTIIAKCRIRITNAMLLRNMSTMIFCCHPLIIYITNFFVARIVVDINAHMYDFGIKILIKT